MGFSNVVKKANIINVPNIGELMKSQMCADDEIMQVFTPGDHGSTFGGNPLGAAVAQAALDVIVDECLPERADEIGGWFMEQLRAIDSPHKIFV